MRWEGGRRSDNIEDRRGMGISPTALAGGGIGTVLLVVVALFMGVDPSVILDRLDPGQSVPSQPAAPHSDSPAAARQVDFVKVVLADTEDTWGAVFRQAGRTYEQPKLVLVSDAVESGCGFAQAAVGPFYCPVDGKLYLDLGFFREMRDRLGAPGEFAQAYVV